MVTNRKSVNFLSALTGLTAEDKVTSVASDGEDTDDIIVPLVQVTVWKTSGTTVSPVNKDLPCLVNGKTLTSEANLLPGGICYKKEREKRV